MIVMSKIAQAVMSELDEMIGWLLRGQREEQALKPARVVVRQRQR